MQNIDDFGQTDISLNPNYHQQHTQNQASYQNYQQNRSDFVVANQFNPTNHGYPGNNKFIVQNSDQFTSYQNLQLCNENVDFNNQYQAQDLYEAQFKKQQIDRYQQDNYNHQNFNSKFVQNTTGLFLIITS